MGNDLFIGLGPKIDQIWLKEIEKNVEIPQMPISPSVQVSDYYNFGSVGVGASVNGSYIGPYSEFTLWSVDARAGVRGCFSPNFCFGLEGGYSGSKINDEWRNGFNVGFLGSVYLAGRWLSMNGFVGVKGLVGDNTWYEPTISFAVGLNVPTNASSKEEEYNTAFAAKDSLTDMVKEFEAFQLLKDLGIASDGKMLSTSQIIDSLRSMEKYVDWLEGGKSLDVIPLTPLDDYVKSLNQLASKISAVDVMLISEDERSDALKISRDGLNLIPRLAGKLTGVLDMLSIYIIINGEELYRQINSSSVEKGDEIKKQLTAYKDLVLKFAGLIKRMTVVYPKTALWSSEGLNHHILAKLSEQASKLTEPLGSGANPDDLKYNVPNMESLLQKINKK